MSFYEETVIRRATAMDALGIAIVQAYTWRTTYTGLMPDAVIDARLERVYRQSELFEQEIASGKSIFVLECKNTIVGFASCGISRSPEFPEDGEIYAIYILKGFQGGGLGKRLFQRCAEALRSDGHSQMFVNCLEGNPSILFYQRMGGRITETRSDVLKDGHVIRENVIRFSLPALVPGNI